MCKASPRQAVWPVLTAALAAWSCGSGDLEPPDAGSDAALDADVATDALPDVVQEAATDALPDVVQEAAMDALPDVVQEAATDAQPDVVQEAATDATTDAPTSPPDPAPVLWLDWDGYTGGAEPEDPLPVSLDGTAALSFDGDDQLELSDAQRALLPTAGPFTVMAEVQVQRRPYSYDPILSTWQTAYEQRSFELGVERTQFPYLLLSGDGTWGDAALQVDAVRQVRLGSTYLVTGTYDPGTRVALFLNGTEVGDATEDVPDALHVGDAVATVGSRSGGYGGLEGVIGQVLVFDQALSASEVGAWAAYLGRSDALAPLPPVRAITRPPGYHWFGYYDKHEFDPTGRYVLGQKVDFEGRSPEPDDVIEVGMVDLQDNDAWIPIGDSRAWSWQQGCMLQWRPGSSTEVLWNDRQGDGDGAHFVTRVKDVQTGILRTLPHPVHHVSPDGSFAIGSDFSRWAHVRPGYGYAGVPDPYQYELAPAESTIYRMDLDTGETTVLFTLEEIAAIPHPAQDLSTAKHYFSVIQFSDGGQRFLFFHRWLQNGMGTRIFTAAPDGTDLRLLTGDGGLSHMDWEGEDAVLVYTSRGSYDRYADLPGGGEFVESLLSQRNGHQTYFPGYDWLLTDTYPDRRGNRHVYLYDILGDEIFVTGSFYTPAGYGGEWRCDAHPRLSRDGTKAVVDSPHDGGRQLYLIDFEGFAGPHLGPD